MSAGDWMEELRERWQAMPRAEQLARIEFNRRRRTEGDARTTPEEIRAWSEQKKAFVAQWMQIAWLLEDC